MTDDSWRKRRDEETDFGPPLFGDDAATDSGSGGISFGDSDTGPLPHWTEPPTGEIPRVLTPNPAGEPTDDLDVWSSFSGQSPSSRDGFGAESSDGLDDITGLSPVFEQPDDDLFEDPAVVTRDESVPVRREQGRITIGTDPTDGAASRPTSSGRRPRPGDATSRGRPGARPATAGRATSSKSTKGVSGRDMPTAIAVGLAIAAVFIGALKYKPWAVAVIVVVVLGLGAV
ncbi:MAG TPA: hypothetical protein DCQ52_01125, partial [Acidimicrobiaceae bacterium]|nr:hypothetical protein [Acidimicrobiaceae bacterium]